MIWLEGGWCEYEYCWIMSGRDEKRVGRKRGGQIDDDVLSLYMMITSMYVWSCLFLLPPCLLPFYAVALFVIFPWGRGEDGGGIKREEGKSMRGRGRRDWQDWWVDDVFPLFAWGRSGLDMEQGRLAVIVAVCVLLDMI